ALLPSPVRLLEQRIHCLSANDVEQQTGSADLAEQLSRVRSRRRRALLTKVAVATLLVAAVAAGAAWLAGRATWLTHLRERNATLARLAVAAQPLPGDDIARTAAAFRGDDVMLGAALCLVDNPEASDAARLNAVMLSSELLRG